MFLKGLEALHINDFKYEDVKTIYGLKTGDIVDELGILFPRLDVAKELEELAKIEDNK